jgi:Raf kinase inhibitor-like YbhB/YbcL family protein
MIPVMYTCDAKQVSPPLTFSGVPDDAHSLVLIMEDRDIPTDLKADGTFLHWTVFDIPPTTKAIETGEVIGVQGSTGNGVAGYIGPCPPRGREPSLHHYYFDVYALDATLDLPEGASVSEIRRAMQGHELSHATLMATYERSAQ